MKDTSDLQERLFRFAIEVILYMRTVKNTLETVDHKRQLNKAATSAGANYEESQAGSSRQDSRNKIAISLREMRESNYWLRIFYALKSGDIHKCTCLVKESVELKNILGTILNKLSIILLVSCIFLPCILYLSSSSAQQPPQWTQYVFNNYMLNPAVGGTKGYMDIKLGYRYQWLGIFNAPPRTMFVSVHTPFNLYQEPTEYTKQYQGIGGSISNDVTGPISNITGKISWSFHKRLTRDMWSSAGISGGVMQYRLNAGGLAAGPPGTEDANDPDVRNISAITPDVQGGVWVASDKFFSGFSIEQIIPLKLGGTKNRMKHHYLFNGGYRHNISPWLAFIPSAEIKTGLITPLTFDVDVVAEYRNKYPGILEKISVGVGYRKHDAVLLLAGVVLGNWEIGYSFDYTLSSLGRYSSNTHELIIGFRFTNIEKEPRCPKWG